MQIYLTDEKNTIQLPVLPEGYSFSYKQNNQTVNIVSLGDLNLKGNKGLSEMSFSSFFPAKSVHGGYIAQTKFKNPLSYINLIKQWVDKSEIIRVIITETSINQEFLINEFSFEQNDGSGDYYYSISFAAYVRPKVTVTTSGVSSLASNRKGKAISIKLYTVKKGETLKSIAKKQLGSSKKYTEIAKLNFIGAPYKITVGQVLKIK